MASMDRWLPSFMDELEKIAVSKDLSAFRQSRKGRRPLRVSTLMKKETAFLPHKSPLKWQTQIKDERDAEEKARESREHAPGVASRGEAEMEGGKGLQDGGY